jgi:hypothetical protein
MSYLGSNATALFENGTNGFVAQTAKGVFTTRTIGAGTGITISNADGVAGAPSFSLTSGVIASPGTFTKLTVDTYGRVTTGANLANSDIITAVGSQANNTVLAGPASGGPSAASWRQLANTDISGLGTMSTQAASGVVITGGTVNGVVIGGSTAAAGSFTTLSASTSLTVAGTTVTSIGSANGLATLDGTGKLTTAQIPASLVGAVVYQGTWNASTNTPALASGTGTKGYYYKVSVAGTTAIDGISQWNVGDTIIYDGTTWDKIDGIANEVLSVAGRTGVVTLAVADVSGAAPLASPALTGTPTAPTATAGTNTTQLATTAFVAAAVTGGAGVTSVIGYTGAVTLANLVTGGVAPLASPALTGTPTAPTGTLGDNSTTLATTAFADAVRSAFVTVSVAGSSNVTLTQAQYAAAIINLTGAITANIQVIVPTASNAWIVSNNTSGAFTVTVKTSAGTGIAVTQGKSIDLYCDGTNVLTQQTDYASIALTGVSTAPTATAGTNTTQIATTAFVQAQFAATSIVNSVVGVSGTVTLANLVTGGVAPLASPTLTGTPVAPTAAANTNTTQLATTAFVMQQTILENLSVFTTTGNYTVAATDCIVIINKATGAATGVTLPSSPATGRTVTIKDGKGDAATNNITITPAAGTIDGAATLVLDQPYEAYSVVYNGSQWNIV